AHWNIFLLFSNLAGELILINDSVNDIKLLYATNDNLDPLNGSCAFFDGARQLKRVTIHRVIDNQYLHLSSSLLFR
ncbi:MAG: hypothetical protein OEW04_15360, partial [Nitrospirota bacterium]|nr:hypothetical protein [Nitrospirota bacterium]